MKKSKGITLITLILYIALALVVLAMLATITAHFRNNVNNINAKTVQDTEFDKLNVQILKEINEEYNKIDEETSTSTKIVFSNGNIYEYISADKAIYLNTNIKIAENIESCSFAVAKLVNSSTANTEYIDKNGDKAIIPARFSVSGLSTEQTIEDGLVIYLDIDYKQQLTVTVTVDEQERETEYIINRKIDWSNNDDIEYAKTTFDQFVWIPITNINDMFMCQSKTASTSCNIALVDGQPKCTTHNSTAMAGRLYSTTNGESFNSSLTTQTYTTDSGLREPDVVTDTTNADGNNTYLGNLQSILGTTGYDTISNFKDTLQTDYNAIVKSIYNAQGFWVGRYETSNMTTTDGTAIKVIEGTTTGISNINWYYMFAQNKDYATNKGINSSAKSYMILGTAYDQVLKFVNTSTYDITTAGEVAHNLSSTYNTGSQSGDLSKNIYDLEGNVLEWTTEASSINMRVIRGGWYGQSNSASNRNDFTPDGSVSCRRFSYYIVCRIILNYKP